MIASCNWIPRSVLLILLLVTGGDIAHAQGRLVIAGGAVSAGNEGIHRALLQGLLPSGPLVIIPAASGRPAGAASDFAQAMTSFGLSPERIRIFPVAMKDDRGTDDIDERQWQRNAWDEELVASVANAAGFWFTGGDQMRIVQLLREGEQASPLLQLVRARLAAGAVVGGTSAGAAVQSASMITGGDSFTALVEPGPVAYQAIEEQESGHLSMTAGLGFLESGLVDQHFDRKARLGRLVRAMSLSGDRFGYGIDEDTALVVDAGAGKAEVVGAGTVTVLDVSGANFSWDGTMLAEGIRLSLFPAGTSFNLTSGAAVQVRGDNTVGNEYFGHSLRAGGGMAFPNQTLEQMLGNDLLDNAAGASLQRWSVDASGQALVYHFRQTAGSRGYWDGSAGGSRYTVTAVEFAIEKRPLRK